MIDPFIAFGLPGIGKSVTLTKQETTIMANPNETPSMDQLWDSPPDNPNELDPAQWEQWIAGLSPKALTALEDALAKARGTMRGFLPRELWGHPGESKSDVILANAERDGHTITTIEANVCGLCGESAAVSCPKCEASYCAECFEHREHTGVCVEDDR